jgi:hypothetical protein
MSNDRSRPAPPPVSPPDPEQPWVPQPNEPFWVAEGVSLSGCPTYWTGRKHTDPREVFTTDIHDAKPFHTREECAHAIAERSVAGTQPREHMLCAPAAPVSPPPGGAREAAEKLAGKWGVYTDSLDGDHLVLALEEAWNLGAAALRARAEAAEARYEEGRRAVAALMLQWFPGPRNALAEAVRVLGSIRGSKP